MITINFNWIWVLPVLWTFGWLIWYSRQSKRYGLYDFSVLFDVPMTLPMIALGWLVFFIIMWWVK